MFDSSSCECVNSQIFSFALYDNAYGKVVNLRSTKISENGIADTTHCGYLMPRINVSYVFYVIHKSS